ncbi:MAG: cyclic nucleotide-binding domain-containing protein [Candidatus Latescibacteria bacterium]|nr:cyclic nucleotide-binding domain-containing protein [Candidatus Latescibacterota bacterium]
MESADEDKKEQKNKMIKIIERIPVFADLSPVQKNKLLSISMKKTLEEGEILCKEGENSDAIFILLVGKLSVKIVNSATVATINPIGTIGEMGVFTGETRSATVEAMEKSALLAIRSEDINNLIGKEPMIGLSIMRRVIKILAKRIQDHNIRIREFQNYILSQDE